MKIQNGCPLTATFLLLAALTILAKPAWAERAALAPAGGEWKYWDSNLEPPATWKTPGFDDSGWRSGRAQLGYGDGDETTAIDSGSSPPVTTYFRRDFTVSNAARFARLHLKLLVDDGAAVYLNGVEVWRHYLPAETLTSSTFATALLAEDPWWESHYYEYEFDAAALAEGRNVLAVEVHQNEAGLADMSFDLELSAATPSLWRKEPYLIYPGYNGHMTLCWQLHDTTTCTLEWGRDESHGDGQAVVTEYGGNYHLHQYKITGLTPGAKYYYRAGANGDYTTGSFFAAPPDDARSLKFLAYGDTRSFPDYHNQLCAGMLQTLAADPAYQTFLLHCGDFVSASYLDSAWDWEFFNPWWRDAVRLRASMPLLGCKGNHEHYVDFGVRYRIYWPYPYGRPSGGMYWSFDYGPAHVAVLDQYDAQLDPNQINTSMSREQLQWLEADLRDTPKAWKFVLLHHPAWSAGTHPNNREAQVNLQGLFEHHGVSIVLGGHNHYYARAVVNGVQHVTTGAGGAPLYFPDPTQPHVVATARVMEYCKVEIEDDVLQFEAVDPAGVTIDRFTMNPLQGRTATLNWPLLLK